MFVADGGGNDSIFTFNEHNGDLISLNRATDAIETVIATASTLNGNTTVTLHDGSSVTLIGVSSIDNAFFTTHLR